MPKTITVGEIQASAVDVLILDVCHVDAALAFGEASPLDAMRLDGRRLTVFDRDAAFALVCDAANGCDDTGDREFNAALTRLGSRILHDC